MEARQIGTGREPAPGAARPPLLVEGALGGLAFGLCDLAATGVLRAPTSLALLVLASSLVGGLACGALAALVRGPRGTALALVVGGSFALEGLAFASHDLSGATRVAFLVGLALAAPAAALLARRALVRSPWAPSVLLLCSALPSVELVRRALDTPWAPFASLALPPAAALVVAALSRRAVSAVALAALALLLFTAKGPTTPRVQEPPPGRPAVAAAAPSVCLIVVDTLRADEARGSGDPATSILERLSAGGVRFEQAIASAPWTLPSTASLLTALHPTQHGALDVDRPLARDVTTLAERFAAAGYDTAAFTGGGFVAAAFGLDQGFATFDSDAEYRFRPSRGHVPLLWHVLRNRWLPQRWLLDRVDAFGGVRELRGRVQRWLEARDATRPYFLLVHTYEVHDYYVYDALVDGPLRDARESPLGRRLAVRPTQLIELEQADLDWFRTVYRARIEHVDRELAALLDALEAKEARPLVVALTADHGEGFDPALRRVHHGGRLHDDLLRVPLLLRAPGLPAGRLVEEQVRTLDLGPTLLALAGVGGASEPPDEAQPGRSLLPALGGREPWPSPAWGEERGDLRSLRTERWKVLGVGPTLHVHDLQADPLELPQRALPEAACPPELLERWHDFETRWPPRIVPGQALDEDTRAELRALGYVD